VIYSIFRKRTDDRGQEDRKEFTYYIKVGKENIPVAMQSSKMKWVRSKRAQKQRSRLTDVKKWRHSLYYEYGSNIAMLLEVPRNKIPNDLLRPNYNFWVSDLRQDVVVRLNIISKRTNSKHKFKIKERKKT